MTVLGIRSAGACILQTADPAMALPIGVAGLVGQSVELGQEVRTGFDSAGIYEQLAAIIKRAPFVPFSTSQIATLLDLIGAAGRCINADGSHPGFDALFFSHDQCDARDLTASLRYRIASGLIIPETLSVEHQGRATLSARAFAISVSGNEPIEKSEGVTYSSVGVADTEEYGLYQQTVGGVNLTGCKSLRIEFGVAVTQEDADGSIFPEWISVGSVVTRVTLGGINQNWLHSTVVPMAGKPMTHANTVLRLAAYDNAGASSYKTLASAVHLGFSLHGLGYIGTAVNASDNRTPATSELMLVALHDGSNVPLQFDTTFALA